MEPDLRPRISVYADLPTAQAALAEHVADRARAAVRARGRFRWVLSGGSTPRGLYRLLATRKFRSFPWGATEVFFADERCVPPSDPASNFGMAEGELLAHVPIPPERVHRMEGEIRPRARAAVRYERVLRGDRTRPAKPGGEPFDVVLLGIGPDGHTASLFPRSTALRAGGIRVLAVRGARATPPVPRLTLSRAALANSREICFLVSGADKAEAVRRVFSAGAPGTDSLPASRIRSRGLIRWFVDLEAATGLAPGRPGERPVTHRRSTSRSSARSHRRGRRIPAA